MTLVQTPERRHLLQTHHDDPTPVKHNSYSVPFKMNTPPSPVCSPRKLHVIQHETQSNPVSLHGPAEEPESTTAPWLLAVQYATSLTILTTCVVLIMAGIMARETPVAQSSGPLVAGALMWFLIAWLGILEGGQGCLVGLQPVASELYEHTHPLTAASTRVAHRDGNLNRFIVGRQFLVVLVVFLLNLCCTTVDGAVAPGVPPALLDAVVTSGIAVMLITVMLGQLAAEVNATNCMLDFINTRITVITTYFCLIIEASGLLHAVYLVECFFPSTETESETADSAVETTVSETSQPSIFQQVWYWTRVGASVAMLTVAMTVTCAALWHGETTMYPGLDTVASFGLFFGLVCFLGILEAIQIAVFAVVKLPSEELDAHPIAQANCELVFKGRNFKAVLIGRQICVTTCMFLLARITTTNVDPADLLDTSATDSTVMGVPAVVQNFFNTGLPGALITTIVASLAWRIVAASFPIYFMSNPIVLGTIRLCLLLEASGIFSAAWLLAEGVKRICGFRTDDEYLSDDEEKSQATLSTRRSSSIDGSDNENDNESLLEWSTRDSSEFSV